ncbi:hypothetical protein V492_08244 [Pseudogymnoascus sp. VKM F-4246]|nr:hypothetical protein V492_08244 [Pseudogymnoascus sp. VKM F-4246]
MLDQVQGGKWRGNTEPCGDAGVGFRPPMFDPCEKLSRENQKSRTSSEGTMQWWGYLRLGVGGGIRVIAGAT